MPAMFVASAQFVEAADAQSSALGFPTVARVFTPHPIQDRTDDEMIAYADPALAEIVAAISTGQAAADQDARDQEAAG